MTRSESVMQRLDRWEELRERGIDISAEELCGDDVEQLAELKKQIEQLKAMDWLEQSNEQPSGDGIEADASFEPTVGKATVPAILGDRYAMESLMAEGGFSQVWRAQDLSLQRPVAVKVTTVDCRAEARRVAQLKHHGIVTVHDIGNSNGLCYIVFDLVEGTTLEELIARDSISSRDAARLVLEIAKSLQYAHEHGFIHRDIKPANILIDRDGMPILADFGIAVTECELRHEAATSIGTLAYMAPEQLRIGGAIDVRTDIYGLGVVLYELLTRRRPFSAPTLSQLRDAILSGNTIPPNQLDSRIPVELATICLKCLSRKPDDRYPKAADLVTDLHRYLQN